MRGPQASSAGGRARSRRIVRCGNRADDREAEAGARPHRVRASVEGLEYPLALVGRNARAGVRHGQRAGAGAEVAARSTPSPCRRPANSEARCRRGSTAFRAAAARRRERCSARRRRGRRSRGPAGARAPATDARQWCRGRRRQVDVRPAARSAACPARASDSSRLASSVACSVPLASCSSAARMAVGSRSISARSVCDLMPASGVRSWCAASAMNRRCAATLAASRSIRPLIEQDQRPQVLRRRVGIERREVVASRGVDQRAQLLHRPQHDTCSRRRSAGSRRPARASAAARPPACAAPRSARPAC